MELAFDAYPKGGTSGRMGFRVVFFEDVWIVLFWFAVAWSVLSIFFLRLVCSVGWFGGWVFGLCGVLGHVEGDRLLPWPFARPLVLLRLDGLVVACGAASGLCAGLWVGCGCGVRSGWEFFFGF